MRGQASHPSPSSIEKTKNRNNEQWWKWSRMRPTHLLPNLHNEAQWSDVVPSHMMIIEQSHYVAIGSRSNVLARRKKNHLTGKRQVGAVFHGKIFNARRRFHQTVRTRGRVIAVVIFFPIIFCNGQNQTMYTYYITPILKTYRTRPRLINASRWLRMNEWMNEWMKEWMNEWVLCFV